MKKLKLISLIAMLVLQACVYPVNVNNKIEAPKSGTSALYGRDTYALLSPQYNAKATGQYPTPVIGVLDHTFGDDLTHLQVALATQGANVRTVRIHMINTVCLRNSNCGVYEIAHGYSKASFQAAVLAKNRTILTYLSGRVRAYQNLALKFPNITWMISPALEHDLSEPAWRVLADQVRAVWNGVQLVNSPDGGIAVERYLGAYIERHGNHPQSDADFVSLDGVDAGQIDWVAFQSTASHAVIKQIWTGEDNCRVGDNFIDPRKRLTCPTGLELQLLARINDDRGSVPTLHAPTCKTVHTFASPEIWKPLAERQINPDPRSDLPLVISARFKSNAQITVIASDGTAIGVLGYYSTYLNLGWRWYSGYGRGSKESGYQWEQKAKAKAGSPYIWLQQGSLCEGPIIGGRRNGTPDA